jgi:hypothetical protein
MSLKNKTCIVFDYGMYFYVAQRLAEDFGKVLYCLPAEGAFPTLDMDSIGRGFDSIERIDDDEYERIVDSIDLFVFPDVGHPGRQARLRRAGKRVFGCGDAEVLEQDRDVFKRTLDKVGLPTIKYNGQFFKKVVGVEALKAEMERRDDFWIKISKWRGISETFHHTGWASSAQWFYEKSHILGERRDTAVFHLEDSVNGVEIGHDSFFTDGGFLPKCLLGVEAKNSGYSCRVANRSELPAHLTNIDTRLTPVFSAMGVRGAMSTEVRVTPNNTAYFIDATMRKGAPPYEIASRIWKNYSNILWSVAGGESIVPEPSFKYGASIFLYSDRLKKEYTPVCFPDKYADRVQLQCAFKNGDQILIVPQDEGDTIGAAIGLGNTKEAAEVEAMEVAESIKSLEMHYDKGVFESIDETLAEAKKLGIKVI